MNIKIPNEVNTVLHKLHAAGFEAFIVGGCVRDSLCDLTPLDWDVTTSATPDDMLHVFDDFRTIPTGLKHGTLTILIDAMSIEVTTFRIDGDYADHRHPAEVRFSKSLKEDLSRRDFTINAMAYEERGGITDFFGGQQDVEDKRIRCVGNPDIRFNEDALRILRALRFAATLGFEIEEKTSDSIFRNMHLLSKISKERIAGELVKLLCGKDVTRILLAYREVFAKIIPEVEPMFDFDQHNKHHIFDVWEHTAYAVGFATPNPVVRLTLLLHDIGKPHCYTIDENGVGHFYGHSKISANITRIVLHDLRFSTQTISTVHLLVQYHDYTITPEPKIVKRRLAKFSEANLRLLLQVKRGDGLAHNPAFIHDLHTLDEIEQILDDIIAAGDCVSLANLAVDGNDLLEIGIPKGKKMGQLLQDLLLAVMDDKVSNEKTALLSLARQWNEKKHG